MRTAVIVNPESCGGRTRRRWPLIAALISRELGPFESAMTESAGHASTLAQRFVDEGYRRIIAVGGDGTFHEVANGLLAGREAGAAEVANRGAAEVDFGLIPTGTAGDLRRSLGTPAEPERAVAVLARGHVRRIDAGRLEYVRHDGQPAVGYCLNMASFGLGGRVAVRASHSKLPVNGNLKYLLIALAELRKKAPEVEICVDGRSAGCVPVLHAALGNADYQGGGIHICPSASPSDGLLDLTLIKPLGVLELLMNLRILYNGRICSHPKVEYRRGASFSFRSAEPVVPLEIDGEPVGRLPLAASVLRGALNVVV